MCRQLQYLLFFALVLLFQRESGSFAFAKPDKCPFAHHKSYHEVLGAHGYEKSGQYHHARNLDFQPIGQQFSTFSPVLSGKEKIEQNSKLYRFEELLPPFWNNFPTEIPSFISFYQNDTSVIAVTKALYNFLLFPVVLPMHAIDLTIGLGYFAGPDGHPGPNQATTGLTKPTTGIFRVILRFLRQILPQEYAFSIETFFEPNTGQIDYFILERSTFYADVLDNREKVPFFEADVEKARRWVKGEYSQVDADDYYATLLTYSDYTYPSKSRETKRQAREDGREVENQNQNKYKYRTGEDNGEHDREDEDMNRDDDEGNDEGWGHEVERVLAQRRLEQKYQDEKLSASYHLHGKQNPTSARPSPLQFPLFITLLSCVIGVMMYYSMTSTYAYTEQEYHPSFDSATTKVAFMFTPEQQQRAYPKEEAENESESPTMTEHTASPRVLVRVAADIHDRTCNFVGNSGLELGKDDKNEKSNGVESHSSVERRNVTVIPRSATGNTKVIYLDGVMVEEAQVMVATCGSDGVWND